MTMADGQYTEKSWNVVKFSDGKLGIVPENWIFEENKCVYPTRVNAYVLNALIDACSERRKDWPSYSIVKFFAKNVKSLEKAKSALSLIESESSGMSQPEEVESQRGPQKNSPSSQPKLPSPPFEKKPDGSTVQSQCESNETGSLQQSSKKIKLSNSSSHVKNIQISGTSDVQGTTETEVQNTSFAWANNTLNFSPSVSSNSECSFSGNDGPTFKVSDILLRKLIASNIAATQRLEKLGNTSTASSQNNDDEEPEQVLDNCPLKNLTDFFKLDKKLTKSKGLRKKLRGELKLLMMKTPKDSCRSLAQKLLDDSVASQFSWTGRPTCTQSTPKRSFNTTKIHDIIYQCVNASFPQDLMTAQIYKENLSDWFAQAKFRQKRRMERAEERNRLRLQAGLPDDENNSSSDSAPDESD